MVVDPDIVKTVQEADRIYILAQELIMLVSKNNA